MKVVGLDLSLTSTGVATILDGEAFVDRITSSGKAGATVSDRQQRLARLRSAILEWVTAADLVVVEAPAFSRTTGHQHDRSGLWWLVVSSLAHFPVVEIPPTSRAKYATGKGNCGKDGVLAAVVRRYTDVEVTGNDEADALVLAAMGARHLGQPIEASLPQTHLDAMTKIAWPELVTP